MTPKPAAAPKEYTIDLIYDKVTGVRAQPDKLLALQPHDKLTFKSREGPVHVALTPSAEDVALTPTLTATDLFSTGIFITGDAPVEVKEVKNFRLWCRINNEYEGGDDVQVGR